MRQATAVTTHHARERRYPVPSLAASDRLKRIVRMVLSGAGLFLIIMTLTPFQGGSQAEAAAASTGNIVNQVGYLALGSIYTFAMLTMVDRRVLAKAISPSWIILFALAFWSCRQSYDPAAATRGVLFTLVSMTLIAGLLLLPKNQKDFAEAGANAILLLLAINYAAIILAPDIAIHTAASGEPWHAGSWRGHLVHKNFAAPVFSVIAMFGIYCWRSGVAWRGAAIVILAVIFVLNTHSKTTNGLLPLAIAIVFISRVMGRPGLMLLVHAALTIVIACLTFGTILSPTFLEWTGSLTEDVTFTGRDEIWKFGLENLKDRFWQGYGMGGFWVSPITEGRELNYEATWDVRGIVSGHNSYLDVFLTFGVPAGAVVILLLMVKPMIDYLRAYRNPENRVLADFFAMIVVFMTYIGMLESFLLNRSDPVWLVYALGVFGLGIVRSTRVR